MIKYSLSIKIRLIFLIVLFVAQACSANISSSRHHRDDGSSAKSSSDAGAADPPLTNPAYMSLEPLPEIKRWSHNFESRNHTDLTRTLNVPSSPCAPWLKAHFVDRCHHVRVLNMIQDQEIDALAKQIAQTMFLDIFRGAHRRNLESKHPAHREALVEMFYLGFKDSFEVKTLKPLSKEKFEGTKDVQALIRYRDPLHKAFIEACVSAAEQHHIEGWCKVLEATFPESEEDEFSQTNNHRHWWQ